MAEIAPSAQGPQGAIAQACQRARAVVANGALRGPSPGQARFDSVVRASAAHDRRPRVVRCSGGDRTRNWRRLAPNGIAQKASTNLCTYRARRFRLAGRTRSRIAQVSSSLSRRSERRGCSACPTAIVPSASSQGSLPAQSPGISSAEMKPVPTMARSKRSRCVGEAQSGPVHLVIIPARAFCTLATSPFCFGFGHTRRQSTWSVHRNISES